MQDQFHFQTENIKEEKKLAKKEKNEKKKNPHPRIQIRCKCNKGRCKLLQKLAPIMQNLIFPWFFSICMYVIVN